MVEDIDRIAKWMNPLADLHIPVIWHPLHEAQGKWWNRSIITAILNFGMML